MSDQPDLVASVFALRSFELWSSPSPPVAFELAKNHYYSDHTYKVWRSIAHHHSLDTSWLDGSCEATCGKRLPHTAPDESCTCGIFGALSYAELLSQFPVEANRIVAVFEAEGITLLGTRGLRTQFARVIAYWVSPAQAVHALVAKRQFVDAVAFTCPFEMCDRYGIPLLPNPDEPKETGARRWST